MLFFDAFPLQDSEGSQKKNDEILQTQFTLIEVNKIIQIFEKKI